MIKTFGTITESRKGELEFVGFCFEWVELPPTTYPVNIRQAKTIAAIEYLRSTLPEKMR